MAAKPFDLAINELFRYAYHVFYERGLSFYERDLTHSEA